MSEKFTSLLAACAATFVVFAAASPALAAEPQVTVTATEDEAPVRYVSYQDLDLVKEADARTLVRRVRLAAKDVCTESVDVGFYYQRVFSACRSSALQGATPQVERAVTRAREIAANGWSAIAPVAITISAS